MIYSIIIPHKNSSTLLKRLILSIPCKIDTQIIVVDDNSTQFEYEEVERLSKAMNFELYRNSGKTAGGARNTGLKYAKGKWLLFADADDYYEPNMDLLLDKYAGSDHDIVFFNVNSRYTETGLEARRSEHVRAILQKTIKQKDVNYLKCCYTAPWGKMIRRSLIMENGIRFDEVVAGNDMWFSVNTGLSAKQVTFEMTPLYCITVTPNSITKIIDKEHFDSRLLVTLRVNNLLREHNKGKYQISVLYFMGRAYQFGLTYMLRVWGLCLKNKSNLFIGINKITKIRKVIKRRQNL